MFFSQPSSTVAILLSGALLLAPSAGASAEPLPALDGQKGKPVDSLGDPLPLHALARLGTRRLRESTNISSSALAPDGKLFVTGSSNGPVRLWDVTTGKEVCLLGDRQTSVWTATFSPE